MSFVSGLVAVDVRVQEEESAFTGDDAKITARRVSRGGWAC